MTLGAAQDSELPDMLALSHAQPYGGMEGDVPGFAGSGQLAQELTEQACLGSDPALAIPLPHTRAMHRNTGLRQLFRCHCGPLHQCLCQTLTCKHGK